MQPIVGSAVEYTAGYDLDNTLCNVLIGPGKQPPSSTAKAVEALTEDTPRPTGDCPPISPRSGGAVCPVEEVLDLLGAPDEHARHVPEVPGDSEPRSLAPLEKTASPGGEDMREHGPAYMGIGLPDSLADSLGVQVRAEFVELPGYTTGYLSGVSPGHCDSAATLRKIGSEAPLPSVSATRMEEVLVQNVGAGESGEG